MPKCNPLELVRLVQSRILDKVKDSTADISRLLVGYSATTHIQTHNKQALKHKTKTPKRETGKS